jgi:hypothetical protein
MRRDRDWPCRFGVRTHKSELHSSSSVLCIADEGAVELLDAGDGFVGEEEGRHGDIEDIVF